MKFKYFQVMEKETLDQIESCLVSRETRNKALNDLAKSFGSFKVLQFNGGGVAAFLFNERPCKVSWKNVKHGYMPKAKSKELKLLSSVPVSTDYRDIIKKYGFGGEMILGVPTGRGGFAMYSSSISGNRATGFYVIKVPYQDDFDKSTAGDLKEIQEWEMIKGIASEQ